MTLNIIIDYGSNFGFVKHVLPMDTTFPGNKLIWRALTAPAVHYAFYAGIILWEAACAGLIAFGVWKLWTKRSASAAEFAAAKPFAAGPLTLNLLRWFTAFITIGGEWSAMWRSQVWNGQAAAFRTFA